MELGGVVTVDAAVARARDGEDGALALLEAGGRHFGGVWSGYALGREGKAKRERRDIPHSSLDRRSPRIVGDMGIAVVGDIGIVVGDIGVVPEGNGVVPEGIGDVPGGIGIIAGDMVDVRGLMGTPVSV